jgi:hypothetical protein
MCGPSHWDEFALQITTQMFILYIIPNFQVLQIIELSFHTPQAIEVFILYLVYLKVFAMQLVGGLCRLADLEMWFALN